MDWINLIQLLLIKIPFIIGAGAVMYLLGSRSVSKVANKAHKLETKIQNMENELIELKNINLMLIEKIIPSEHRINAYKNISEAFYTDDK